MSFAFVTSHRPPKHIYQSSNAASIAHYHNVASWWFSRSTEAVATLGENGNNEMIVYSWRVVVWMTDEPAFIITSPIVTHPLKQCLHASTSMFATKLCQITQVLQFVSVCMCAPNSKQYIIFMSYILACFHLMLQFRAYCWWWYTLFTARLGLAGTGAVTVGLALSRITFIQLGRLVSCKPAKRATWRFTQ